MREHVDSPLIESPTESYDTYEDELSTGYIDNDIEETPYRQEEDIDSSGFQTPYIDTKNLASAMRAVNIQPSSDYDTSSVFGTENPSHAKPHLGHDWDKDSFPAWADTEKSQVPISVREIAELFGVIRSKFGFQTDNMRNMFEHLMVLLDSRASRMGTDLALVTLHADYIGGENSNYKKWYFAAQLDIDDSIGYSKTDSNGKLLPDIKKKAMAELGYRPELYDFSLETSSFSWKASMNKMPAVERISQLILYLLCWGEANQVRFMPECLAFIFKCAFDFYKSNSFAPLEDVEEGHYLDTIITPLYNFYRGEIYREQDGVWVHRERDHKNTIGYDDMNQLFWYREGLQRIVLADGSKLIDLPKERRYLHLKEVQWASSFYKTYKESRSWLHMAVNFNRVWIIHLSMFWFYTTFNSPAIYTINYQYTANNQPPAQVRWSIVSLGGAIGPLINIIATFAEWSFVPRQWPGAQRLILRLVFLLFVLAINVGPSIYILGFLPLDLPDPKTVPIFISHMVVASITTLFFSIVPLGAIFGSYMDSKNDRHYLPSRYFTADFHKLSSNDRLISSGLWICVFVAKLTESYFFLTLSIRDPVRELLVINLQNCIGDWLIGPFLCKQQPKIVLALMYVTDLVLFFLDTYLWYIIFNTVCSVARSFYLGASIWTPWRNVFARLPKRIYSKVLCTRHLDTGKFKSKHLVSQIWNAVVISMYREHLIPIEHVKKLIYRHEVNEAGERVLFEPTFFISQEDQSLSSSSLFEAQSEAKRRISFFAQSLATPIPDISTVESMPSFTVLIPHYGEKIMLTLREIIREENERSKVTLLEYLKQLHPSEWECFVRDTKGICGEDDTKLTFGEQDNTTPKEKYSDLPYYCVGFKSSNPEFILRTRIWASLRTQTLYRTISGFMNYPRAIKLLYSVENTDLVNSGSRQSTNLDSELDKMANRKFRLIAAVQRLTSFSKEEMENKELLLRSYPELKIAYIIEKKSTETGESSQFYSALIDGHCEILEDGQRRPRFLIRLSGNPILGDGKSDNQNHALIFYRGEYIQLVDANQDNYLEECLKIRSVLAEFEEMKVPPHPYAYVDSKDLHKRLLSPVAILGAREYVFSENIGVLGDIAAGKEQTFGTLFARTLAKIGGKLHYGHPDFLNGIFMTTRGGVSKAQKGLHLNEDIYAGMNALVRGGRIKHCEYSQCGKGRDLGFGSILNFTTKIGAGMGEQMLSREYFYLGTQLPLDRFLSFYYAHAGFHVNNMFIVVSLQLFLLATLNVAALTRESVICDYNRNALITDLHRPLGCNNVIPVIEWIERCLLSIFVVFFISFLPLFVQELTERGFWRSVTRLGKHFACVSPFFEVFVCQIYAQALTHDLSVGGAKYISTGRGFATARTAMVDLYSRFAPASIYFGAHSFLILIYVSMTMWRGWLLWFWVISFALCFAPFLYNPHQFSFSAFVLDYREFLRWMCRGNTKWHRNSWIGYARNIRTSITGYKSSTKGDLSEVSAKDIKRPNFLNVLLSEVFGSLINLALTLIPYLFINSQSDQSTRFNNTTPGPLLRLGIISFGPIVLNALVLLVFFFISCLISPILSCCSVKTPATIALVLHLISVLNHTIFFHVLWLTENWDFPRTIAGLIASIALQSFSFNVVTVIFLSRELPQDYANRVWWSGEWLSVEFGWRTITQPGREFLCKIMEMTMFSRDFVLGHFLFCVQAPILLIPYVDKWHSMMLFWLRPSKQIRPPVFSTKQRRLRKRLITKYSILFVMAIIIFAILLLGPPIALSFVKTDLASYLNFLPGLVQPPAPVYGPLGISKEVYR